MSQPSNPQHVFPEEWLPDTRRQYFPEPRQLGYPHPQPSPSFLQYQPPLPLQPYAYEETLWKHEYEEPVKAREPRKETDSTVIERIQLLLPAPPLAKAPLRPEPLTSQSPRRAKRKSKFTREQDQLILSLKRQGRSWVEIANITNVGSYLAARNRYQVIVGQQGSNHLSSWTPESKQYLQRLLDAGELCKWDYIAQRLSRSTGKHFTSKMCRDFARFLLFSDPESLGVTQKTVQELEKEHELTNKLLRQAVL
ncbi:uncharacterized protein CXQ87_005081 [Candidozyma duobushaemuli]|uniref:Myb-like domain-containing protein n=2 Tax=Candidozyma TaxID=3303203 RepID=A0ABX8IAH9_9ASCO|nr:uncharacterized protein CXQ87_005081 [[Candida] duobushaemulonis]PVH14805.1 hypothetical protein CXQ87_005081 [[Candida] duobushaemulonis]QWU90104.1 hypothetical protein CA3LBN_004462 [[Candida] haemuloni]